MKRAFVIGHPISHSRSPKIHGYWIAQHGLDASYEAIDVPPEALSDFFAQRLRAGEFVGGNVTVPHKEQAFALCDSRDPQTSYLGAFNTLTAKVSPKSCLIHGQNTDFYGFLANLDQQAPGWDKTAINAIVLGAGGAARAVVAGLAQRLPGTVHVLNRTPDRARELAAALPGNVQPGGMENFEQLAPNCQMLVNTTTVGMRGTSFGDLPLERLPAGALVTDIVYTPLETPLLAEARRLGFRTVDGLGMLLHQAVPGFESWFGVRPEVTPELRRLIEATI